MRICVDSMGCRLNIGESEDIARRLAARGHRLVGPGEGADLYVLNTCAVTHVASRKSRKHIRQLRRRSPAAAVVVTGCYAELEPAEVGGLGVDMVIGNADKDRLPAILERSGLMSEAEPVPEPDAVPPEMIGGAPSPTGVGRTRAFVKVQDGCDNRCTFCIVTVARGRSRSRGLEEVVAEIRRLVDLGYREAVLSGVHLGSYGHDRGDRRGLEALVRAILADTDLPRLRLSSLEPWDLDGRFFRLWEDSRLLPHLHLPLQSGCDATLRRMARRTSRAEFAALVEAARAAVPDVSITTDVIVGFPGESEAEFEESIGFVEATGFAKLHVFRYSPRRGTAAAAMPGRVRPAIAKERSRRMHALGDRLERRFRARYIGRRLPVLWETCEERERGRRWTGLTGNYLRVLATTDAATDLTNEVVAARMAGTVPGALLGEIPTDGQRRLSERLP